MKPQNYIEQLRKRFFSVPLHLFDYVKTYEGIVFNKYFAQKIQSIKDLNEVLDFCFRHNCIYFLVEEEGANGLIAIIKKQIPKKPLFVNINTSVLVSPFCVN